MKGPTNTFPLNVQPGEGVPETEKKEQRPYQGPSPEEAAKIREAIANAKSIDEVMRLEQLLKRGQIPEKEGSAPAESRRGGGGDEEVEMDEE